MSDPARDQEPSAPRAGSTPAWRAWLRLTPFHLFAVVAVAACVAGGFWQLGAYESRQGDAAAEAQTEESVPVDDVWGVGEPFTADLQNRSVDVSGTFGPAADQVWVRGPQSGDATWLVAPFVVDGSDAALLVVRGQAPDPDDLPDVADVGVPPGEVSLTVSLQPSSGGGTPLDAERRTTAITVPSLLNELPYRLWSGYGIVTHWFMYGGPEENLPVALGPTDLPDPDVSWTVGLKNLAYAFQWWIFAAFAVFMWWRMSRDMVAERRGLDGSEEPTR